MVQPSDPPSDPSTPGLPAWCGPVLGGLFCLLAAPLAAEVATEITLLEAEENAEYAGAVGYARIETRLNYVDEANGDIPMDGSVRVTQPVEGSDPGPSSSRVSAEGIQGLSQILVVLGLGLLAFLLLKFGSDFTARFRAPREADGQGPADGEPMVDPSAEPRRPITSTDALLAELRAMPDREAALHLLISVLLEAAGAQTELQVRRAETTREFIRRLPSSWPRLSDLRRIAMTEEIVKFGGRPLEEKTFEDCLRRALPILQGVAA